MMYRHVFRIYSLFLLLLVYSNSALTGPVEVNESSKIRIENKIYFFSECKKADIEFVCLNTNNRSKELCSEFGVTACGMLSVYTNIANTWVQTSLASIDSAIAGNAMVVSSTAGSASMAAASTSAASASAAAASAAAASAAAASAAAASAAAASAAAASAAAAVPPPPA